LENPSAPVPRTAATDLVKLAADRFHRLGRAAEIGVFQGDFAATNLMYWKGKYFGVDAWDYRKGESEHDKNFKDEKINQHNYEVAQSKTDFAGSRVKLIRNLSIAAARTFPDEYFDWIYIDALHTKAAAAADLSAWWPKLRHGGLLSGDDFGDAHMKPLLKRWQKYFGKHGNWVGIDQPGIEWGVIGTVQDFAKEHCIVIHATWLHDCYTFPAWYAVKPF